MLALCRPALYHDGVSEPVCLCVRNKSWPAYHMQIGELIPMPNTNNTDRFDRLKMIMLPETMPHHCSRSLSMYKRM